VSDGPDRPWTDDPNTGGTGQPPAGQPPAGQPPAGQPPAGSPPPSGSGAPGYGAPPPMDPNAAPPAGSGGQPPVGSGGQPPVGYGGPPPAGYGGPPPGAPQVGMPTATAGLGARIGARLLDGLIVGIPASIILGLIFRLSTTGWISSAILSLLWFGYFVLMESNRGATVGKGLLNLRVVGADGRPPTVEQAAKRNVWMLIGLIPTFLGGLLSLAAVIAIIVTISSNAANRGIHDQFADTAVMR
jgi:uncharacterized RDD family membrane protein YckC